MNKKALSFPLLLTLVIGNTIGTGIYLLPATLAQFGTISIFGWIFTSIGALFLAFTFTSLSKRFTKTGGPYVFCKEAFGKPVGFAIAYNYWFANMLSIAGISVAAVSYMGFFIPDLNAAATHYQPHLALYAELGLIWLFTLINIIGIHEVGLVQFFLTILKIIPLILIALIGIPFINFHNLAQFNTGGISHFSAISGSAAITFWAFVGIEAAVVPAESTSGSKDITRATILGTLIIAMIYIACTAVLMGMIPTSILQNTQFPFAEAGKILFGHSSALFIAICAVISGMGTLNSTILMQGQIVFAAARDHLFPKRFSKLSKHDAPVAGQLLSSTVLTLIMIISARPSVLAQFNQVVLLAAFLMLTAYLMSCLAELKFILEKIYHKHLPLSHLKTSKPFYIALFASSYSLWMISSLDRGTVLLGLCILLASIPIYFVTARRYAEPV